MIAESLINSILFILKGGLTTLAIWVITVLLAIPCAILIAIIRIRYKNSLGRVIDLYTGLIRGTPLLFQLFFIYFGLALIFKINLPSFLAAVIAFTNSWMIYLGEVFRGGFNSVDKSQYETCKILGLNYYQTMRYVILPQAIIAILPEINNQVIEIIWSTSLLSTIGVNDILKASKVILMRDLTITPFIIAAFFYLLFNNIITLIFKKVEKKCSSYKPNYKYL